MKTLKLRLVRRLLVTAFALLAVPCLAAVHVYFPLAGFNANPATNRWVTLQWQSPFIGNLNNYTSSVAGGFWVSNVTAGDIVGTIKQKGTASEIRFQVTVSDDDDGELYATNITSVLGVQTYPSTGRSAYSIQAANNRFARIGSGGLAFTPQYGTDNLTNWAQLPTNVLGSIEGGSAYFGNSSNVTVSVESGTNVFTVTGEVPSATATRTATNFPNGMPLTQAVTNQDSRAILLNGGVTAAGVASSQGISAVNNITTSAGQFIGDGGGLTNTARHVFTNNFGLNGDQTMNLNNTPRLKARLSNTRPLRILMFCDDAFTSGSTFLNECVSILGQTMTRNGVISSSGGTYYSLGSATTVSFGVNNPLSQNSYYTFTAGQSITNITGTGTGIPTTTIPVMCWLSNNWGNYTVYTQSLSGGVYGSRSAVGVINGNVGAAGAPATPLLTNFSCALDTVIVSVVCSGVGAVQSAGQYNTNTMAGFVFDNWDGANMALDSAMTTYNHSNFLRAVLPAYDAVLIADLNSSLGTGTSDLVETMAASSSAPFPDIYYAISNPNTNSIAATLNYKSNVTAIGASSGRPVLDIMSLNQGGMMGQSASLDALLPFYNSDGIHGTAITAKDAAHFTMEKLGLMPEQLQQWGYSGYAALYANNTLRSNLAVVGSTFLSDWITTTGSTAGLQMTHRDNQNGYLRLWMDANAIHLMSTLWTAGIVVSNSSGTLYLIPDSAWGNSYLGSPTITWKNVYADNHYGSGSALTGDDEAYDASGWNSDTTFPTKNAVRDKIESLSLGDVTQSGQNNFSGSNYLSGRTTFAGALVVSNNASVFGNFTNSGTALMNTVIANTFNANTVSASDGSGISGLNANNLSSGVVGSSRGGAGTVNGIMKANGSGTVSAASADDLKPTESIIIACSDETTALTAGTGKIAFRMPYAFTVTAVRGSLTTAQASGNIFTVDINEAGTTILSTKLTIDNTEKTSTTAATAAVISDSALADDAEITVDIDQIGNGSAAGLKVVLIGHR